MESLDIVLENSTRIYTPEEKLQFAEKLCALRQNYAAIAQTAETLAANRAEPAVQYACAAICSCVKAGLELL